MVTQVSEARPGAPGFDRNLNTGKDAASSTEFVKATNTVLHDAVHPSALILPVVGK